MAARRVLEYFQLKERFWWSVVNTWWLKLQLFGFETAVKTKTKISRLGYISASGVDHCDRLTSVAKANMNKTSRWQVKLRLINTEFHTRRLPSLALPLYLSRSFVDSLWIRYRYGSRSVVYQPSSSMGGSSHRRMSNDQPDSQPQCPSAPLIYERSDSWTESRDTTFSRILFAEEFLAVSCRRRNKLFLQSTQVNDRNYIYI